MLCPWRKSALIGGLLFVATTTWAACPPIQRSSAVRRAFQRQHPCPSTGRPTGPCHQFIVDHIIPLCLGSEAGGRDTLQNLQWQTVSAAKAKDRIERQMCRAKPRPCPHQGD